MHLDLVAIPTMDLRAAVVPRVYGEGSARSHALDAYFAHGLPVVAIGIPLATLKPFVVVRLRGDGHGNQ
jgi:hypothetical protein